MSWQHYEVMTSIAETIEQLAENKGQARVVAGGTDLLGQGREVGGEKGTLTLLDISQIKEIRKITESGGYLFIGAATTMAELASSALVQTRAHALSRGASWMGSPQIRNVATLGGNVVDAQPAGDGSLALVALGAEACVVSSRGDRYVPVESLFLGVGESRIDPCRELISTFRIPVCQAPDRASTMHRLAKRKAFTFPTLSLAVCIELDAEGERFSEVRIAAGPVSSVPWRAKTAEEALQGEAFTMENIQKASALASKDARPHHSLRGGAAYRRDMVEVLTRRALLEVLSQLSKEPYA